MSVVVPHHAVIDMLRSASADNDILIVAPYIKHKILKRFLDVLSANKNSLTCITRWLPADIASGACDIELFEYIQDYGNGTLMMHPYLHAKYYRAGNRCLIGSANLTGRGLNWIFPNNLELLVELPKDFTGLAKWESSLAESAVEITEEIKDQIQMEANQLKSDGVTCSLSEEVKEDPEYQWVPSCPAPDRLWDVYKNNSTETIISSTMESAKHDLKALSVPPKIIPTKEKFESFIANALRQSSVFHHIDDFASKEGITDNQACELIAHKWGAELLYTADQSWTIIKKWLIYFFPETYMLKSSQEVLIKGKKL